MARATSTRDKSSKARITFRGRTAADAKRQALNYWFVNKDSLGLTLREYGERLVLLPDGKTIVLSLK